MRPALYQAELRCQSASRELASPARTGYLGVSRESLPSCKPPGEELHHRVRVRLYSSRCAVNARCLVDSYQLYEVLVGLRLVLVEPILHGCKSVLVDLIVTAREG
jgi:hypothetical protein